LGGGGAAGTVVGGEGCPVGSGVGVSVRDDGERGEERGRTVLGCRSSRRY
jgi:hypothetical protein